MQSSIIHSTTEIDATPPSYNPGWQSFKFNVHNFETLQLAKDVSIPIVFHSFGCNWQLDIYLGGKTGVVEEKEIAILRKTSGPDIDIQCMSFSGEHRINFSNCSRLNSLNTKVGSVMLLQSRQEIIEKYLSNGTYTVTVYIKQANAQSLPAPIFVPNNPCSLAIQSMANDEKTADVLLEITGTDDSEPMKIHAHLLILRECAPILADLCEDYARLTPVPITGVKPFVFHILVGYVYGQEVPKDSLKLYAKEFIEAADMYGISTLKIEAETVYVNSTPITIENVVDNFYFADTKKCALLKEKVMEFLVENGQDVLDKLSLQDGLQSATLFRDFMTAVAMEKSDDKGYDGDDPAKFKVMSVNVLRRKLSDRGLSIDGTREMMIAGLEQSYAKSGEKRKRDE